MNDEMFDDGILAVSIIAALLGISMLASGDILALGPLIVALLGFASLKVDVTQINGWRSSHTDTVTDSKEDALDVLRQRYARGEIDHAEFEQRLNDLLETETTTQAEKFIDETPIEERSQEREL